MPKRLKSVSRVKVSKKTFGVSTSAAESKGCYGRFLVIPMTLGIGRGTALGESS
jgi:hypothetical protein